MSTFALDYLTFSLSENHNYSLLAHYSRPASYPFDSSYNMHSAVQQTRFQDPGVFCSIIFKAWTQGLLCTHSSLFSYVLCSAFIKPFSLAKQMAGQEVWSCCEAFTQSVCFTYFPFTHHLAPNRILCPLIVSWVFLQVTVDHESLIFWWNLHKHLLAYICLLWFLAMSF